MARFSVKTQSENNAMLLHSAMQREFTTDDLSEAMAVFHKEVAALDTQYTHESKLSYAPTDYEVSNAIYCEVVELVIDEEGEVEDINTILSSDKYYAE